MEVKNRVAIYCRLSKDDEQSGDSVSIETQRMMLTKYCEEYRFEVFDIYIDDGFSGLNFNRPAFKRLLADLENGEFNTVITKDLSRLGRDYIQTGYYIDIFFASKKIRYIAVNDGIDTANDNNDIAPFKNILNDMYARDLSRKVKSAKRQRAQNGLFIGAQPPFGYRTDPCNKNHLIIDIEAADTVKLIYELCISGHNYSEISRILEERNITNPSAYKVQTGDTRFLKHTLTSGNPYKWSYQTVSSILNDPVYMGDMVNHKVEVANYKTKRRISVPKEEQIVVHNTHEPIISRELFAIAREKNQNRRCPNHSYENAFKGLVCCMECGSEMLLITQTQRKQKRLIFRCQTHCTEKTVCSHYHSIAYDELLLEVQNQLYSQIVQFSCSPAYDSLCTEIVRSAYACANERRKGQLQKELQAKNKQLKELYGSSTPDNLSGCFATKVAAITEKRALLIQQLVCDLSPNPEKLQKDIEEAKKVVATHLYEHVKCIKNFESFIEKVEVGHLEYVGAEAQRKIIIRYRF